jgi:GntR family transcriptional regulator
MSVPKYIEISNAIIQSIESGEYLPGDKIPSENELIKKYNTSNTTARKSLQETELKGWATRIKGKGTFVLNRSVDKHITRQLGSIYATRMGFDENLKMEGFSPKTVILEKTVLEAGVSTEIGGRHFIMEGPVMKIHQLRYSNDLMMKDEIKYISLRICPKIHIIEQEKPFFKIYEEDYQLKVIDIKQMLSVSVLYPDFPENHFETPDPLPVFILDGTVFCEGNKVVEIEKSLYRGDKYKFSVIATPQTDNRR